MSVETPAGYKRGTKVRLFPPVVDAEIVAMFEAGKTDLDIVACFPEFTRRQIHSRRKRWHASKDRKTDAAATLMRQKIDHRPPPHVLMEREHRLNAPRDLNMVILGDPCVPRWNSNA